MTDYDAGEGNVVASNEGADVEIVRLSKTGELVVPSRHAYSPLQCSPQYPSVQWHTSRRKRVGNQKGKVIMSSIGLTRGGKKLVPRMVQPEDMIRAGSQCIIDI